MPLSIDHGMPKEMSQTFARRARHSSKAIITAIVLTLAALLAIAIAAHDKESVTVKTLSPLPTSGLGSVSPGARRRPPAGERAARRAQGRALNCREKSAPALFKSRPSTGPLRRAP